MNKKVSYLFGIIMLLAGASCSNNNDNRDNTVTRNPHNPEITGTCTPGEYPTGWKVVEGTTYSSMCVILDEYGIPATADSADLMAAFVGNECRGVAQPIYDPIGKWRFNLLVNSTSNDEKASSIPVVFRYYSAREKGTYASSPIQYQDEAILGSYLEGYVPSWL